MVVALNLLGLVIYAVGFGFTTLIRTLVTATVPKEQISRLYSGLALAETMGSIFGALFMTAAFTQSVSAGGWWWSGVPVYACGVSEDNSASQRFNMFEK